MNLFSHDIVVFDLESTASVSIEGFQRNNYIIDIGAVFLDKNLEIKGKFESLVKPEEAISPFVEKLTGISNAMVSKQDTFDIVGEKFQRWVLNYNTQCKRVRLASWGAYFDGPLLRKLYEHYGKEFPFSGTIIDVKSLAILKLSLMKRRTDQLKLKDFSKLLKIDFEGKMHRALSDAHLTAEIFRRLVEFFHNI